MLELKGHPPNQGARLERPPPEPEQGRLCVPQGLGVGQGVNSFHFPPLGSLLGALGESLCPARPLGLLPLVEESVSAPDDAGRRVSLHLPSSPREQLLTPILQTEGSIWLEQSVAGPGLEARFSVITIIFFVSIAVFCAFTCGAC